MKRLRLIGREPDKRDGEMFFLYKLFKRRGKTHLVITERDDVGGVFSYSTPCAGSFISGANFVGKAAFLNSLDSLRKRKSGSVIFKSSDYLVGCDDGDKFVPEFFCLGKKMPMPFVQAVKDSEDKYGFVRSHICIVTRNTPGMSHSP